MKNILVVDDNEQNLYMLKILFEGHGYELAMAKNGIEALEVARSSPPDLIISDILMPGMDGFALCREWKADSQLKKIPFIFYTATYTDIKDEEFALSLGAERFVRKPAEPDQFIDIVREVLAQHDAGKSSQPAKHLKEEDVYFKKYNEVLIHKMEDKMLELEGVNKRLSALFQASIDLTSYSPMSEIISCILKRIIDVLGCTYGNYFVYEEDKKEFHLQMAVGFPKNDFADYQLKLHFHLGEERGLVGLVGQTQEPLIINDTFSDPRWIIANESIKSAMLLPMVCEGRLVGVLSMLSTETGRFNRENLRDLATLANILAVAIEKARFFEEIKRSEESARESEKFLDSVIENIPDMIFVKDARDLRFVRFNKAGEELMGFSKLDMYGKNDFDFFPSGEAEYFFKKDKETLKKKHLIDITEETILTKDKGERILHTKKIPILDEKGNSKYLLGISEDITERKQASESLRESQERFSSAFNFSSIGMALVGLDGNYLQVNHALCEIVGYSEKELLQKKFQEITHPDDLETDLGYVRQLLTGKIPAYQMEKRYINKQGYSVWVLLNAALVHDEEGKPLYFLSQVLDITKRKHSEQLLATLNQAAIAMGAALTTDDVFDAVAEALEKLDISCMLFPINETQDKLFTKYMSFKSAWMKKVEKLVSVKQKDFSFSIDLVDSYKKVIIQKKALLITDPEKIIKQILPKSAKKLSSQIEKILQIRRSIVAPLIVGNQVIGMFSVLSDELTLDSIPIITAFADQFAGAWNKVKLLQDMKKTLDGTILIIAATVEARDPYTAGHQKRVADLAAAIAHEMHLPEEKVRAIAMAGLIHDLGKINVPAEILSKPGKLSELEYGFIKTHPQVGYDLLKIIDFPWPLAQIVLQHHERMNGSGYPQGLMGQDLLLESRILAVADVVEAMVSHRPYRPALGVDAALNEIRRNKKSLFDSQVVNVCLKLFKNGYKVK